MTHKEKPPRTASIHYRFLKLLAAAFIAASLFFVLLNRGGTVLLESYFAKNDYMGREKDRSIENFKNYVKEHKLSATDLPELTEWVKRQSVVWVQIYRDSILLYDSQYPYMKANAKYHVEGRYYEWESYYQVEFADGIAQVFLTGMYTYRFFNYAMIVEFFLSFLLFTGIIMAGINRTIRYIRRLSTEIGILEGGNLDYPITVIGNDEMALLARGLDSMRESVRAQMKQEAELITLNQSMITSLSHDLRTPLTALIIYTEILKNGIDGGREKMHRWIHKIDEKAHQIKDMADCILEYSLNKKTAESGSSKQEPFNLVFRGILAETCADLKQSGFSVRADLRWEERDVCVIETYISRIFDNINSNIIKYASRENDVRIAIFYDTACCGFLFENTKKHDTGEIESTGIGIQNIRTMMDEMGGKLEVEESEESYKMRLTFGCTVTA